MDSRQYAIAAATVFEQFLRDKEVRISNPERDREIELGEDENTLAILYGTDYYELEDKLTAVFDSMDKPVGVIN